jgi:hypothetical protein
MVLIVQRHEIVPAQELGQPAAVVSQTFRAFSLSNDVAAVCL